LALHFFAPPSLTRTPTYHANESSTWIMEKMKHLQIGKLSCGSPRFHLLSMTGSEARRR
jgi:hypothetical protein